MQYLNLDDAPWGIYLRRRGSETTRVAVYWTADAAEYDAAARNEMGVILGVQERYRVVDQSIEEAYRVEHSS